MLPIQRNWIWKREETLDKVSKRKGDDNDAVMYTLICLFLFASLIALNSMDEAELHCL